MDKRSHRRLLARLLLLPLLGMTLLAIGLGYALQRVETANRWVDHSDQIIARANRIGKLMVDEETGVRGYLLTRDSRFLAPYMQAQTVLLQEFDDLFPFVRDNPAQTSRLQKLRASHAEWDASTRQDIVAPPDSLSLRLLARKDKMDSIRAQMDAFLEAEDALRMERGITAANLKLGTWIALLGGVIVIAGFIFWLTRKSFRTLSKAFQAQLAESQTQYDQAYARQQWLDTTLRSIGDGVIACDPAGQIVFMNPVAEQLTGWKEKEARSRIIHDVFRIVNEATRETVESPVDKVRRTGTVVGLANHTVLIQRNGSELYIDDSGAPIRSADKSLIGIVLVFRDISERRLSEEALMRAEKLATAGKLAASIAHEVNNPLEGLINTMYLARHSARLDEAKTWIDQAESEISRISHITRQTLGFYRENTRPASFRPANIIREVLAFYAPRARAHGVNLSADLRTELLTFGVSGELRQVLSNLIANSLDAVPAGGTIKVALRRAVDLRDGAAAGVRISISDSGTGIDSEHLARIFEPFFTTKLDTGTGLGLWVSKDLVEKNGGRMRVRSCTSGRLRGTVFSIYLPLDGSQAVADEEPEAMSSADA